MRIAIIDYGSGNLRSAAKAFERAARESGVAARIDVTADPRAVIEADRIVLPGVGAFADCRAGLYGVPDMVATLEREVLERAKPFIGICVGMQLMATRGLEHGVSLGLDWIGGDVIGVVPGASAPKVPQLKVPHMGWNELTDIAPHPVLAGIAPGAHAYFVHSYVLAPTEPKHVLARAEYGGRFAAMVGRDNMIGTQFHPEKSQETGLRLIANFLRWKP